VIDPRERLEEYVDGLLAPDERAAVERALEDSAELRAELERVRRFGGMMEGLSYLEGAGEPSVSPAASARPMRSYAGRIIPLILSAAAAAALVIWLQGPAPDPVLDEISADWNTFGERLAKIALERRAGRVPRTGLSDLEVPPAKAFGRVYTAGVDALGIELNAATRATTERLVHLHFTSMCAMPDGVAGEWRRSESALELYRDLRRVAGREAADAYYDLFRPGLTDSATVMRVPGNIQQVLADRAEYLLAYEAACRRLKRRYGEQTLTAVMHRLAPNDGRYYRWDAAQDGAAPDAVLSIRAALYRAAAETGTDLLYVQVG